jgi:hypothetical protein
MTQGSMYMAFSEDRIDAILADSFPASDPPPWTMGRENRPFRERVDDSPGTAIPQDPMPERGDEELTA